jgi:hypothetical protein
MSDFENSYTSKCPDCGQLYAECEGPWCDCLQELEEEDI